MRFMVLVKASEESEAGVMPAPEGLADMDRFSEEMIKGGVVFEGGGGLQPTSKGARLTFTGAKPTVTDGPFAETKELVAGYCMFQVKSKAEAIEWFSRAPFAPGAVVEIRQLFEAEDFA